MDEDVKFGIGVALNEAALLGAEMSRERRLAIVTLSVLSLPEKGPPRSDPRVLLVLESVGRVVASLRQGHWDDQTAPVVPFPIQDLLQTVQSFGGQAIYGWEFIDIPDANENWMDRLSFDEHLGTGTNAHSISLFQEGINSHLDLKIWFDTLRFVTLDQHEIPLVDFIAGGRRWWDGLQAGDSRTDGHGIVPG